MQEEHRLDMRQGRRWRGGRPAKRGVATLAALAVGGLSATVPNLAPAASAAPKAHSSAPVTVLFGAPIINAQDLPLWVADSEGFAAKNHVNLKLVSIAETLDATALNSGSVQFLQEQAGAFLKARAQNLPQIALSVWNQGVPTGLILSNDFVKRKHITASTPLQTVVHDMIGSRGGLSATTTQGQANILLRSYGVQPSQLTEVMFSAPSAAEAALEANEVDWFVTGQPVPDKLQQEGYGLVVADRQNAKGWKTDVYSSLTVTTPSYAKSHPQLMRAVVDAIQEATTYIHDNPRKVLTIMQQNIKGLSRPLLLRALQSAVWPTTDAMTAQGWRVTIAFNVKQGELAHGTKVSEGVDWTNSYLPKNAK